MKLKKVFLIIAFVLVSLIIATTLFVLFANYSTGDRVGTVSKFSHKGVFFKTWEGQLITGSMAGGTGGDVLSTVWEFSVYPGDREIRKALQTAMDQGKRVKLRYEEKYFQFDWRGDTKYFVVDIEEIKKE